MKMVPNLQQLLRTIFVRYIRSSPIGDSYLTSEITQNEIFFVGDIAAYNLNNDLPASAVVSQEHCISEKIWSINQTATFHRSASIGIDRLRTSWLWNGHVTLLDYWTSYARQWTMLIVLRTITFLLLPFWFPPSKKIGLQNKYTRLRHSIPSFTLGMPESELLWSRTLPHQGTGNK